MKVVVQWHTACKASDQSQQHHIKANIINPSLKPVNFIT